MDSEPWYRQFWPWLIIALPASVVLAGLATLWIALENNDSRVRDSFYKDGMAINRDLARDELAADLGLGFVLDLDRGALSVSGTLSGDLSPPPAFLTLEFIHPSQAVNDFRVVLAHLGNQDYFADLPLRPEHRWYLDLSGEGDDDRGWRLRASLNNSDQQLMQVKFPAP